MSVKEDWINSNELHGLQKFVVEDLWIDINISLDRINKLDLDLSDYVITSSINQHFKNYKSVLDSIISNSDSILVFESFKYLFYDFLTQNSLNASYKREEWNFLWLKPIETLQVINLDWSKVLDRLSAHKQSYDNAVTNWNLVLTNQLDIVDFIKWIHGDTFTFSKEIRAWKFREEIVYIWSGRVWVDDADEITNARIVFPNYDDLEKWLSKTRKLLSELWNSSQSIKIIIAILMHHYIVQIHPFEDGNWRTARICMVSLLESMWLQSARWFTSIADIYEKVNYSHAGLKRKSEMNNVYDSTVSLQSKSINSLSLSIDPNNSKRVIWLPWIDVHLKASKFQDTVDWFLDIFEKLWDSIPVQVEIFMINHVISTIMNWNVSWAIKIKKIIFSEKWLNESFKKFINWKGECKLLITSWIVKKLNSLGDDNKIILLLSAISKLSQTFTQLNIEIPIWSMNLIKDYWFYSDELSKLIVKNK